MVEVTYESPGSLTLEPCSQAIERLLSAEPRNRGPLRYQNLATPREWERHRGPLAQTNLCPAKKYCAAPDIGGALAYCLWQRDTGQANRSRFAAIPQLELAAIVLSDARASAPRCSLAPIAGAGERGRARVLGPRAHGPRPAGRCHTRVGTREWMNFAIRAGGGETNVERAGCGSTMRSAVPGTAEETPIRRAPALALGSDR